jgi:hypothetical protein
MRADARQAMAQVAVMRSCLTISLHDSYSEFPTHNASFPVAPSGGLHMHGPPADAYVNIAVDVVSRMLICDNLPESAMIVELTDIMYA